MLVSPPVGCPGGARCGVLFSAQECGKLSLSRTLYWGYIPGALYRAHHDTVLLPNRRVFPSSFFSRLVRPSPYTTILTKRLPPAPRALQPLLRRFCSRLIGVFVCLFPRAVRRHRGQGGRLSWNEAKRKPAPPATAALCCVENLSPDFLYFSVSGRLVQFLAG